MPRNCFCRAQLVCVQARARAQTQNCVRIAAGGGRRCVLTTIPECHDTDDRRRLFGVIVVVCREFIAETIRAAPHDHLQRKRGELSRLTAICWALLVLVRLMMPRFKYFAVFVRSFIADFVEVVFLSCFSLFFHYFILFFYTFFCTHHCGSGTSGFAECLCVW